MATKLNVYWCAIENLKHQPIVNFVRGSSRELTNERNRIIFDFHVAMKRQQTKSEVIDIQWVRMVVFTNGERNQVDD